MKVILVIAFCVAVALAAPQLDKDAVILKSELDNIGVDGYNFAYETSNQISQSEHGVVVNAGSEDAHISVTGEFSYVDAEGKTYRVSYTADEDGFHPEGEHLPHA